MANSIAAVGQSPIIWSGAIGAFVALLSAILLGLFNAWHSSREKNRDRTMTLRKEVYLPLVASIPGVWGALCKLPNTPQFDQKPMEDFGAYANKLAAVAETKTAIIATELSTTLASIFIEMMSLAMPAHECLNDANLAKDYRIKASHKAELVQTRIDEHLQAGKGRDSNFEALTFNLKYHHDRAQEYWNQENTALDKHVIHTLSYTRKLIDILPALDSMRIELLLALRGDMDLLTSENEFKKSMDIQCERMIKSLEIFISSLENKIKADSENKS